MTCSESVTNFKGEAASNKWQFRNVKFTLEPEAIGHEAAAQLQKQRVTYKMR